jgi:hypothetical protein
MALQRAVDAIGQGHTEVEGLELHRHPRR